MVNMLINKEILLSKYDWSMGFRHTFLSFYAPPYLFWYIFITSCKKNDIKLTKYIFEYVKKY